MRIGALTALLLAGAAVPASGQQDRPESLLPPGFDQPAQAPAPTPAPAPRPQPQQQQPLGQPPSAQLDLPPPVAIPDESAFGNALEISNVAEAAIGPVDLSLYELPEFARHSLGRVGVLAAGNTPFAPDSLGQTNGRFAAGLMQRINAPIASRWVSIVLRRALMSPLDTPTGVNGADFAAERAWLLLRMGEAVAARAVIDDVDNDNYTTSLYQVAMQVALATGDPAALCPIVDDAMLYIQQRGWALAQAMCKGLEGKPSEAGQLLDRARTGTSPSDIDNLLAEKILGTGAQGRRAVTIEWNSVTQLTAWRWGLATATGAEVPAELYATAGPQVRYWQALSPHLDAVARVAAAEQAAAAGVFSSAGLVDLYGEIEAAGETGSAEATAARDLRTAYTDGNAGDRVSAIRRLWDGGDTPRTRYARMILTARAAAWVPASKDITEPEKLIASMLSAGLDTPALEWRSVVPRGSEGWALLALADPAGQRVAYGDFDTFRQAGNARKAQLLLAGLAGLGCLEPADARRGAEATDVQIGGANAWTSAIDRAGQRGEPATVMLLAATGMQARNWDRISPEALFHIVAAMRASGMTNYARMVAVEAVTRA